MPLSSAISFGVDKDSLLLFELIGGKAAVNGTFGPAVGCVDGKNAGGNVWMPGALSVGKGVIGCLFTLACVGASVAAWVVLVSLSSLVEATKSLLSNFMMLDVPVVFEWREDAAPLLSCL